MATTSRPTPARATEYRSRALQFTAGLRFPATTAQVLAHLARKNTPMELLEDTMALPERQFAAADEYADAATARHLQRPPHTWTSREIRD